MASLSGHSFFQTLPSKQLQLTLKDENQINEAPLFLSALVGEAASANGLITQEDGNIGR